MRGKKYLDENAIVDLYSNGVSTTKIASLVKVNSKTISRILKRNNVGVRPKIKNTIYEFWEQVVKNDRANGCWIWSGPVNNKGYGYISINGDFKLAHRLSFSLIKGVIPEGAHLCHSCDTPRCCNPDHLTVGDAQYNTIDSLVKGRRRVKLDINKVKEIRALYADGTPRKVLMDVFEVGKTTIDDVVTCKNWKFVD